MFQPRTKTWTPAKVKEETGEPWSYIVRTTDGSELRRNRVQLKPLGKPPAACGDQVATNQEGLPVHRDALKPLPSQLSSPELPQVPAQSSLPSEWSDANLPLTTRSGRVVKKPSRLDL